MLSESSEVDSYKSYYRPQPEYNLSILLPNGLSLIIVALDFIGLSYILAFFKVITNFIAVNSNQA